jgi:hypothetical protein
MTKIEQHHAGGEAIVAQRCVPLPSSQQHDREKPANAKEDQEQNRAQRDTKSLEPITLMGVAKWCLYGGMFRQHAGHDEVNKGPSQNPRHADPGGTIRHLLRLNCGRRFPAHHANIGKPAVGFAQRQSNLCHEDPFQRAKTLEP